MHMSVQLFIVKPSISYTRRRQVVGDKAAAQAALIGAALWQG
jgi:hypothetical protein